MLFSGGFTFSNFLADVLSIFIFVLWFYGGSGFLDSGIS